MGRIRLIVRMDDRCVAVTVGPSNLHAHDRNLARFGLVVMAFLLAVSGLAIGWSVGASLASNGGGAAQAAAPVATGPGATPVDQATPTPTTRPTPLPTGSAPANPTTGDGTAAGGATAAATHLDPQFGMSGNLLAGSADSARAQIGMLADDGLGAVAFDVSWRDMEPSRGTYRGLDALDAVVAAAAARTMQTIVVVTETPGWANGGNSAWVPPIHTADYAGFIGKLARRYAGRVAAWEVWNDPDQARSWLPKPNAAGYARLLRDASRAIRAADPSATVIAGGVSFDQTAYVQALYAHEANGTFDVLAVHPAMSMLAPDAGDGSSSLTTTLDAFHSLLRQEGDEDTPIWVSDLGWAVSGPGAVSANARVDDLQRAVEVVRERPWVGLLTVRALSTGDDPAYGLSTNGRRSDAWQAYAATVRDTGE